MKVLVQERSGSVDFETVKEYNKSSYGKFVYAVPEGDYSEGAVRQESGDKGEYIGEHQARIFVEDTSGWYEHNGIDATNKKEFELADPAIRVYEYKEGYSPANEDGLKWISGDDPDKVFRLTCDSFVQVADSSGDNKAWASRTGFQSDWPYETPPYFVDKISNSYKYYGNEEFGETYYGIRLYGRNREALPFGATIWPDNFDLLSSERVKLKDQYSDKNREEILAGRPYGCSGDNPESCQHIGYCSLNPSVYCLYSGYSTNFEINKKTCANGGYGVCKKIWRNPLEFSDDKKDYKNVLKSLFLKSYDAYSFDYDNQMYSSSVDQGDNYNGLPEISGCTSDRPDNYTSLVGESANPFFCAVYPEIENVKLKYNGQLMGTSNPFSIPKKGVYSLEFNTIIDKEQQPLKEIYINWGDGTEQIVTGQDNRPSVSNPHVVYHYYRETGNNKTIKISVYDNWGFYGSCMSGRCYLPPYHYEY